MWELIKIYGRLINIMRERITELPWILHFSETRWFHSPRHLIDIRNGNETRDLKSKASRVRLPLQEGTLESRLTRTGVPSQPRYPVRRQPARRRGEKERTRERESRNDATGEEGDKDERKERRRREARDIRVLHRGAARHLRSLEIIIIAARLMNVAAARRQFDSCSPPLRRRGGFNRDGQPTIR